LQTADIVQFVCSFVQGIVSFGIFGACVFLIGIDLARSISAPVLRRIEGRFFRQLVQALALDQRVDSPSSWAALTPAALVATMGWATILLVNPPRAFVIGHVMFLSYLPVTLIALQFLGVSFLLHSVPGHSRALKYWLAIVGCELLPAASFATSTTLAVVRCGTYFILPLLIGGSFEFPVDSHRAKRVLTLYRYIMSVSAPTATSYVVFFALTMSGVGLPLLVVARFYVLAMMSRKAILFLRAFDASAAITFSEAIAPAVIGRMQITGVVHSSQPRLQLERQVNILWQSRWWVLPDVAWKDWVKRAVGSAPGVIIDTRGGGDSLQWEIDTARAALPASRLCLIVHNGDERFAGLSGERLIRVMPGSDLEDTMLHIRIEIDAWIRSAIIPPLVQQRRNWLDAGLASILPLPIALPTNRKSFWRTAFAFMVVTSFVLIYRQISKPLSPAQIDVIRQLACGRDLLLLPF